MSNCMKGCTVDAVVTMDTKGQIVLPKELREKANLKPNDKLAIIGCGKKDDICCIIMIKTEKLGNTLKEFLGPILEDVLK